MAIFYIAKCCTSNGNSRIGVDILVHSYGLDSMGNLSHQSLSRCGKALRVYKTGDKIYISVSGSFGQEFVCQKIAQFFLDRGVPKENVVFSPEGPNTRGELRGFIKLLKSCESSVAAVSSWYHLLRIKFLWWAIGGRQDFGSLKCFASFGGIKLSDLFLEVLKLANDIFIRRRG